MNIFFHQIFFYKIVIGPAVPRINPATGIFHGAIRTDYGPFDIPRYARATYSVDPPYERETEEDEDYNPPPSYQREEEEQNYISAPRPYKKKPYYKPESYKPQTYKPYTSKVEFVLCNRKNKIRQIYEITNRI